MDKERCEKADSLFNKAVIYYHDFKMNEAIDILHTLLDEYTDCIEEWNVHEWLGICYNYLDQHQKALEHLLKALSGVDKNHDGHNYLDIQKNLGYAFLCLRKYKKAIKYYENATQYLSHYSGKEWATNKHTFYLNKGRCYFYLRRFDRAIEEYLNSEKEIQYTQADNDAESDRQLLKYEIGRAYTYEGDLDKAERFLGEVNPEILEQSHRGDYYFTLGKLYQYQKKYDEAIKAFESSSKYECEDSEKAELYHNLGIAYYHCGHDDEARTCFIKSMEYPTDEKRILKRNKEYLKEINRKSN